VDDGGLQALAAAVAAAPGNHELRLTYGTRLLQAGRAGDALAAAQHVLAVDPASVAALRVAADAARTDGRADLAVSYRRLLAALGASEETAPPVGSEPAPAPPTSGEGTPASPAARGVSDPPADPPTRQDMAARPSDDSRRGGADVPSDFDSPEVTLYDVAGLDDVKRRLRTAFLGPLRNPELQKAFGATLRGGLLLYGPPGCGKTFIAKALAGELGAPFIALGITDIIDPYIGVSERNLHEHFELARRSAPCVLFLDEIDALGRK
jgi:hypothetical protein